MPKTIKNDNLYMKSAVVFLKQDIKQASQNDSISIVAKKFVSPVR